MEPEFVDFVECNCGDRYTTQQSLSCPNCGSTSMDDRKISLRVEIKPGAFTRFKNWLAERRKTE
jgi:hypothetical protein